MRTLRFRYHLFHGIETFDSGSVLLTYPANRPKPFRLESQAIAFRKREALLRMEIFDQAAGKLFISQSRLELAGSGVLLRHLPDSNVWLLPYLTPGAPYAVQATMGRQVTVYHCTSVQQPAASPFAEELEMANCLSSSKVSLKASCEFQEKTSGIYLFTDDTTGSTKLPIQIRDRMFPEAGRESAINSMIYLLSDAEFSRLKASPAPEVSLDSLWSSWLESENRGARFMNLYQRRFQEANISFTGHMEGWKTDMGMVYMVFGPPDEVHFTMHHYHWVYRKSTSNRTMFHFARRGTLNGPTYILHRQPGYSEAWYEAVEAWRTGKVKF